MAQNAGPLKICKRSEASEDAIFVHDLATGAIINGAIVAVVASAAAASLSVRLMINRPHDPADVS